MNHENKVALDFSRPGKPTDNAFLVAGLARQIETTLQVCGEAEARQVKNVNTALAQGFNGPYGQSHCVWIVGGNK